MLCTVTYDREIMSRSEKLMSRAASAMMAFLAVPAMMAFIVMGSGLSVSAATSGVADPIYRPSIECRFPSEAVLLRRQQGRYTAGRGWRAGDHCFVRRRRSKVAPGKGAD